MKVGLRWKRMAKKRCGWKNKDEGIVAQLVEMIDPMSEHEGLMPQELILVDWTYRYRYEYP